ncbi:MULTISPECIES: DUF2254 domain-containing protein [Pseudomonas]|uniref:DUF2254 domain-containing protein n=1 Tax=Pseudomonas TaxID=286 RepID=UPI002580CD11|nr:MULTISPECIES: DUF2254 domain-containing protein [Pseudomonas]
MERFFNTLVLLRRQLWILPALISTFGFALAALMLFLDYRWLDLQYSKLWWLYSGDAGSASNLLGTFLSGMMTITSLVVSLTFVTLTLAANQLGPRLILNFMGDRQIQSVLGLFLATIFYLIVILRSIDGSRGDAGVPALSIGVASLLTLACLFALLFYVHKIARSTIADIVVQQVARELMQALRERLETLPPVAPEPLADLPPCRAMLSLDRPGYVQMIDYSVLRAWAKRNDAVLEVQVRAGHYLLRRGEHVRVFASQAVDEASLKELREAIIIGEERSPTQDLEYSIRQMVEIALRALSPGINDPFTAIAVIDRLGSALEEILGRQVESRRLFDDDGQLRVIAARSDLQGLADACFDQIRQAGASNPAVLIRIADVLGRLAPACKNDAARVVLARHLERVDELAPAAGPGAADHRAVAERVAAACAQLRKAVGYDGTRAAR